MLSFDKLFGDWFDDDVISFEELEAGTRDHLERLRKGNDQGHFDALITATEARYLAYFGQRSQGSIARTMGKGTTLTLGGAIEQMVDWITGEGREAIYYKLKAEADRLRFFPNGASEYHKAKQAEWPQLLERLDGAMHDLGGKFDADTKQQYATLRQGVLDGLKAQSGQNKQKADARTGTKAERALLTRQLSRNARTLGLVFDEHPEQAATYFDRKYFNQHQPAPAAKVEVPAAKPALN